MKTDYLEKMKALRIVNVVVLIVLLITGWRLYALRGAPSSTKATAALDLGATVRFPGIDLSSGRHIVVVVRSECRACDAGTDFYAELEQLMRDSRFGRLHFVSDDAPEKLREWLGTGLGAENVNQVTQLQSRGILAVPTIMILESGRITDLVIGKIGRPEEVALLNRIKTPELSEPMAVGVPAVLDQKNVDRVVSEGGQLVDPRDRSEFQRGSRPLSVNIPTDELAVRARNELDPKRPVLLVCSGTFERACVSAQRQLLSLEFRTVYLVR